MSKVILRDVLAEQWTADNALQKVRATEGFVAKAKDNRRVVRFELAGHVLYLKHHVGVGWKEIFKNFLQLKLPVLGAINEWQAIEKLKHLNVNTMQAIGFGQYGRNPAQQESFLVTKELANTISLEELCGSWPTNPPNYALRKALVEQVAFIARQLHDNGLNHRDFYLCHILLDISQGRDNIDPNNLCLYLVDLHRMQLRKQTPARWIIKDVGSIYFSALDCGLTRRDAVRFMRHYRNSSVSRMVHESFWQAVKQRAIRLYQRDFKKTPSLPL